jgi:hypothetical protein
VPADHGDKAPTSIVALCFPEPDPLALALCVSARPPTLVVSFDPMLEELAASLVMSRTLEAASLGFEETSLAPATPLPQLQLVQELP